MRDITVLPQVSIIRRQPELIRQEQAKADGIIEYAARVEDWPLLEKAVDLRIKQQKEFITAWQERVRSQGEVHKKSPRGDFLRSPGHQPKIPARGFLSVKQLETLTDIQDSQVSRWRGHTKNATAIAQE